eukprot:scaffold4829_cov129-Cylindrotheca_fusiformis.AAC.16
MGLSSQKHIQTTAVGFYFQTILKAYTCEYKTNLSPCLFLEIMVNVSLRKPQRREKSHVMLFWFTLLLQESLHEAFINKRFHLKTQSLFLPVQVSPSVAIGEGSDQFSVEAQESGVQDDTYKSNLEIAKIAAMCSPRKAALAKEALDLLRSQKYPDTVGYNSVLKALAKTSSSYNQDSAELAQALLEEMEEHYNIQYEENQAWYQSLKEEKLREDELSLGPPRIRVKPNFRTFSTVMDAWARQNNPSGAQEAQNMLEQMKEMYSHTGDVTIQPNVISYNTVLNGWAKAGAREKGAIICENLLQEMGDLADVISYNAVLHAWAKSGIPDAGERAEGIMRSMNTVKPNGRTYNTVMNAWSRSFESENSAKRAHLLLTEMERLAKADRSMAPECISYSTVINAYALSKSEPLKAHKSFGLLQRMHRLAKDDPKLRPNGVTYNSVLNACAASSLVEVKDKLQAKNLKEALPTLPELVRNIYKQLLDDETLHPDHFTFGTVLKAVANLFWGEPDQVEFGKSVFEEACRRGQVSFGVLYQLRQAVPAEVFRALLPEDAMSPTQSDILLNKIPNDWTRNVREDNRRNSSRRTR